MKSIKVRLGYIDFDEGDFAEDYGYFGGGPNEI